MYRSATMIVLAVAALGVLNCGGDEPSGNASSGAAIATTAPTARPAASSVVQTQPSPTTAPTATGTGRPVIVTQAQFNAILITPAEVAAVFGGDVHAQNRSNVTDARQAFTSSPQLGDFLVSQNVTATYNAWAATGQCTLCAVQTPLLLFPNEAAAGAAYQRIEEVNRTIFQGVSQLGTVGPSWDQSFCQLGMFTTTGGQTLRWVFCAMREGNLVITAAIGGFNFNANTVLTSIRAYGTRVETYLRAQFP